MVGVSVIEVSVVEVMSAGCIHGIILVDMSSVAVYVSSCS